MYDFLLVRQSLEFSVYLLSRGSVRSFITMHKRHKSVTVPQRCATAVYEVLWNNHCPFQELSRILAYTTSLLLTTLCHFICHKLIYVRVTTLYACTIKCTCYRAFLSAIAVCLVYLIVEDCINSRRPTRRRRQHLHHNSFSALNLT